MNLTFKIDIDPKPQPRPRFSKGRAYLPKSASEYRLEIQLAAKMAMKDKALYEGAVNVAIKLFRKFNPISRRFGDVYNHCKAITDALTGIVYVDDAQIISCSVEKYQAETPCLEVEVNPAVGVSIKYK